MEITHNNLPEAMGMLLEEIQNLRVLVEEITKPEPEPVTGLKGLAKLLNCGINKALEVKNTGYLDAGLMKVGRSFGINPEKCLELYKQNELKITRKIKKSKQSKNPQNEKRISKIA